MKLIDAEGGCHCGAVRFEIRVPERIVVQKCNCSMCRPCGFIHCIVPSSRFRQLSGADKLVEYRFNSRVARHLFCGICGVKSFYVPRSNPDGFSVNVNCVSWPETIELRVEDFDGENWEENAGSLKHLSQEESDKT